MIIVFVDAGPLYALFSLRDQYHLQTQQILRKLETVQPRLITSDDVINEAITSLHSSRKGGYSAAVSMIVWLSKIPARIEIEWIGQARFQKAIEVFRRYNKDKQWSFTDCTSYVIIKELKIDKVFTFDRHFRQMGFSILS